MHRFAVGHLNVEVYPDRRAMGEAAAAHAVELLRELLERKEEVNVVFAAAPSQSEFLAGLVDAKSIPWQRVNAFHMDEYLGLPADAPQSFGNFLERNIFGHLPFGSVHRLVGQAADPQEECKRYEALLQSHPVDIVFMGIGENGHIAFNDPGVADFADPRLVKQVDLEEVCRQQQVNDGCFASIKEVPVTALTLTVSALMSAARHLCMVPGSTKAKAVHQTLTGPIDESCPASVLRQAREAVLYLDRESASLLGEL